MNQEAAPLRPVSDEHRHEPADYELEPNELAACRFYIDCEFDGHNGVLLSMALVRDDGDGIHIRTRNFATNEWVKANVVPLLDNHNAPKSAYVSEYEVGGVIRAFIGDCDQPVIVADSPVDIGRFCQALSTGPDGGWASADYPAMRFEVHNVDCYPTDLPNAVQHNAWWDAMALRHKLAHLRTPATDTEAMRPKATEAVNQWFAEWQASESKHWGDKITWSTAFAIAARIDALAKGRA